MRWRFTHLLPCLAMSWLLGCGSDNVVSAGAQNGVDSPEGVGLGGTRAIDDAHSAVALEQCNNGVDDDGDKLLDCADSDCEGAACGANGNSCRAGGCVPPGVLTGAPPIAQIKAEVTGDSVVLSVEPVDGAKDYRVYELPSDPSRFFTDGSYTGVTGGTYRCSGDRPLSPVWAPGIVIGGDVNWYQRNEADAVLGHVYVTPGRNRVAVYALGDPAATADSAWRDSMYQANRTKVYTTSASTRSTLLGQGWRDDGVAFYTVPAATAGTHALHRFVSKPGTGRRWSLMVRTEHERAARAGDSDLIEEASPFSVLSAPAAGTVPLYRVLVSEDDAHDELLAGTSRFDRVRLQGNQPSWDVQWSGLSGATTLVVEALDSGCPFQGLLSPISSPASNFEQYGHLPPYVTPEGVRAGSPHQEVFVNGQFDPSNRPRVLARGFVNVAPKAPKTMDWFLGFGPGEFAEQFATQDLTNGRYILTSPSYIVDWSATGNEKVFGTLFNQLWVNFNEINGSNGKFRLSPKRMPSLSSSAYLHVTMQATAASTLRRYPQIIVSSVPPPSQSAMENGNTVILQTITSNQNMHFANELQLQFCDHRTWDVNNQCPQATLPRSPDWSPATASDARWWPAPVLAEYASHDRMVKFDLYMSTRKAYVFLDDKPYGCAVLPKDLAPSGSKVSVAFGTVLYHSGADTEVVDLPDQGYLKRFSVEQTQRHFDDLGYSAGRPKPSWNETLMPCATGFHE